VTVVLQFRSPALALAAFDALLLKPSPELHTAFADVDSRSIGDADAEAELLEVLTVSRLAHAFPESAFSETADAELLTLDARTPEIRPATLADVKVRGAAQRSSFYARHDREAARREAEDGNADALAPIDRKRRREHAELDAELDAMANGEASRDEGAQDGEREYDGLYETSLLGRMRADVLEERPSRRRRITGERAPLPEETADRWVKREESADPELAVSDDDSDGRPLDEVKPDVRELLSRLGPGPEPARGMRGWADDE